MATDNGNRGAGPVDPVRPTQVAPAEAEGTQVLDPALVRIRKQRADLEIREREIAARKEQERVRNEAARAAAQVREAEATRKKNEAEARKREAAARRQRALEIQGEFDTERARAMALTVAELIADQKAAAVLLRESLREHDQTAVDLEEIQNRGRLHTKLIILILVAAVLGFVGVIAAKSSHNAAPSDQTVTSGMAASAANAVTPPATPAVETNPAATNVAPPAPAPTPAVSTPTTPTGPFTANCLNEKAGDIISASLSPDGHFHAKRCLPAGATDGDPFAVVCVGKTRKLPANLQWGSRSIKSGFQSDACTRE